MRAAKIRRLFLTAVSRPPPPPGPCLRVPPKQQSCQCSLATAALPYLRGHSSSSGEKTPVCSVARSRLPHRTHSHHSQRTVHCKIHAPRLTNTPTCTRRSMFFSALTPKGAKSAGACSVLFIIFQHQKHLLFPARFPRELPVRTTYSDRNLPPSTVSRARMLLCSDTTPGQEG